METYRCILLGSPFPLMGKAGIGVLGIRSNQSPLPLSFPVKGKEFRALPPVRFFISRPLAQPTNPIFKEAHEEHEGRRHFSDSMPSPLSGLRVLRDLRGEKVFCRISVIIDRLKICASCENFHVWYMKYWAS